MRKLFRLLLILLLPGIWLVNALPAYAIDSPDNMSINDVWAYRHVMETNDQLYLIDYSIDYTIVPAESSSEAFICRLMNGATDEGQGVPYAYYDSGYGRGMIAIYLSAADAPAWNGAYTMQLSGNPTLAWSAGVPDTTIASFNWSASASTQITSYEITAKVLWMADQLEMAWSVDMIETAGTGSVLTAYGESYFTTAIDNLREFAPKAFSGMALVPVFPTKTYSQPAQAALTAAAAGSPFDFTDLAAAWDIPLAVLGNSLWFLVIIVLLVIITKAFGSYKPAMLFSTPMVIAGVLLGVMTLQVGMVLGFFALLATAYVFFFQKASA